jgi:hypothetical protein
LGFEHSASPLFQRFKPFRHYGASLLNALNYVRLGPTLLGFEHSASPLFQRFKPFSTASGLPELSDIRKRRHYSSSHGTMMMWT